MESCLIKFADIQPVTLFEKETPCTDEFLWILKNLQKQFFLPKTSGCRILFLFSFVYSNSFWITFDTFRAKQEYFLIIITVRNRGSQMLYKLAVLKQFAKIIGKQLPEVSFLIESQAVGSERLLFTVLLWRLHCNAVGFLLVFILLVYWAWISSTSKTW